MPTGMIIGDWYLDVSTGSGGGGVWEYMSYGWELRGSIKGATGATGNTGSTGAPGAKWYTGAGAPAGATGIIGDFYLNTTDGNVHEKTGASAWTLRDISPARRCDRDHRLARHPGDSGVPGTPGESGSRGRVRLREPPGSWVTGTSTPAPGLSMRKRPLRLGR